MAYENLQVMPKLDPNKEYTIEELTNYVRNAVVGENVREALARSMEATNEIATWARDVAQGLIDGAFDAGELATMIESKLNQLEQDYAPKLTSLETEVEDARGSESSLSGRLNGIELQLAKKALKNEVVLKGDLVLNVKDFGALGDGSDSTAAFKDAVNSLSSTGGKIIVPSGLYVLSDTWLIPDNTTLLIEGDIKFANNFVGQTFNQYSAEVRSLITNEDHDNGNRNIRIHGNGSISGRSVSLDLDYSWVGVWLDNCSDSTIEDISIEHIAYDIQQEGDMRQFAALFTMCDRCDMMRLKASYTGDDCLRISSGSQNCRMIACFATMPKMGHCFQAVGDYHVFSAPRPTKNISVIDCFGYDSTVSSWASSGAAFHSVEGGVIKGCTFSNTGSGVLLLGDTSGVNVSDIDIYNPHEYGVYVLGVYDNMSENKITNIRIHDDSTTETSKMGVRVFVRDGHTVNDLQVSNISIYGKFEYGISMRVEDTSMVYSVSILDIMTRGVANAILLNRSSASATFNDAIVSDCQVKLGTTGIKLIGVSDSMVKGCRIRVTGEAIKEEGAGDFNMIYGNNVKGSGNTDISTVGVNTVVSNNITFSF